MAPEPQAAPPCSNAKKPSFLSPATTTRFSHYVRKEKILESALTGEPVRALCGKMWVPGRDPQKFPVCPQCKEIYEGLAPGNDGDNGSGE